MPSEIEGTKMKKIQALVLGCRPEERALNKKEKKKNYIKVRWEQFLPEDQVCGSIITA